MRRRVYIGRFSDGEGLIAAARAARAASLALHDAWTPVPVPALDELLDPRPTALTRLPLIAGAVAGISTLGFQAYAAGLDWPLKVGGVFGGSPLSWVPVAFLTGCLAAAIAAMVGFALELRRPRLAPAADAPQEAFVLALDPDAPGFDNREADALLHAHGAVSAGYREVVR